MLRFSLGSLFLALLYSSVACAALVNANGIWPQVAVTLTVAILLASTLAAIFAAQGRRVFAIGFSATGWLYLLLVLSDVTNIRPLLLTDAAMNRLYSVLHAGPPSPYGLQYARVATANPQGPVQPLVYTTPVPAPTYVRRTGPRDFLAPPVLPVPPPGSYAVALAEPVVDPITFANIGHSIWAVMVGLMGGAVGQVLYTRSRRGAELPD